MSKYILFLFYIQFAIVSYGQSEIGFNGGINQSGFYGLNKNKNAFTNFRVKHYLNYSISIHYKEPVSNHTFAGFELESMNVKSRLDMRIYNGHLFWYEQNSSFNLNYLNVYFLFGGKLLSINKVKVLGGISPYYGYLIHSKGEGTKTDVKSSYYTDSTGASKLYTYVETRDINKVAVLRKANIGMRLNLDIQIPISNKLELSLKPAYHFGFYNVIKEDIFIGIRGFSLTTGLIYHLDKKYLRLAENAKPR